MSKQHFLNQPQTRITGAYLLTATLWILFSDAALLRLRLPVFAGAGTLKGLAFVLVTSGILYVYLRDEFKLRSLLEDELHRKIEHGRQARQALEASEARFRRAVIDAPIPIAIHAEDGEIISLSKTWIQIAGYTQDQIPTIAAWTELAYGEHQEPIRAGIDELYALDGRKDEGPFTIRCADGTERSWLFSSTPLGKLQDGRRLVMSAAADITVLLETQQNLRVREKAMDVSITPFALADLTGDLTYVNRAFLDLWKLNAFDEALGRSVLEFWVSPESAQRIVVQIGKKANFRGELTAKLADGTTAEVELTATMVHDQAGNPLCMMGSFVDVTQRKQIEIFERENERLRGRFQKEQERNALVQHIISALSHDLRTPLAVIQSSKDVLRVYYDRISEERRQEKLDAIGRQVQFALELLEDTVNMARGHLDAIPFKPEPINIAALCQVSIDEIQTTDVHRHRLRFVNSIQVEHAMLDEVLVTRILINLLTNAIKYSPDDTDIFLELDRAENWLVLRVRDHGMGIKLDELDRIFEPFFRVDEVQNIKGTGLGLSIVKDCVDRHKGRVNVESEVGVGSTFTVELPFVPVTKSLALLADPPVSV